MLQYNLMRLEHVKNIYRLILLKEDILCRYVSITLQIFFFTVMFSSWFGKRLKSSKFLLNIFTQLNFHKIS